MGLNCNLHTPLAIFIKISDFTRIHGEGRMVMISNLVKEITVAWGRRWVYTGVYGRRVELDERRDGGPGSSTQGSAGVD